MIAFNFQPKHVVTRDPRGPTPDAQEYSVTLAAPESEYRHSERDAWCRQNVQQQAGERWNGRYDPRTGEFVFSFSSLNTAIFFALRFRGV